MTKNLPIGVDNFKELVDPNSQFLFVDKTKFIADIIDDKSKSILITRPRRWGKTMNFSMLQHFFAAEVNRKATQDEQRKNKRYTQKIIISFNRCSSFCGNAKSNVEDPQQMFTQTYGPIRLYYDR